MARVLLQLFDITRQFGMHLRPELILLQKTMVVVEGVARSFDPKLDIWKVADPVVREWIERNLGPVGRIESAVAGGGAEYFQQANGVDRAAGSGDADDDGKIHGKPSAVSHQLEECEQMWVEPVG